MPEESPAALANALLRAIVTMAGQTRRREAEAMIAARRAGITAGQAEIRHAVDLLLHARHLTNPVELADGGIIVSLTAATTTGTARRRKAVG